MDQPAAVNRGQCATQVNQDLLYPVPTLFIIPISELTDLSVKVETVYVLHGNVGMTKQISVRLHVYDVRVVDLGQRTEFAPESL